MIRSIQEGEELDTREKGEKCQNNVLELVENDNIIVGGIDVRQHYSPIVKGEETKYMSECATG